MAVAQACAGAGGNSLGEALRNRISSSTAGISYTARFRIPAMHSWNRRCRSGASSSRTASSIFEKLRATNPTPCSSCAVPSVQPRCKQDVVQVLEWNADRFADVVNRIEQVLDTEEFQVPGKLPFADHCGQCLGGRAVTLTRIDVNEIDLSSHRVRGSIRSATPPDQVRNRPDRQHCQQASRSDRGVENGQ